MDITDILTELPTDCPECVLRRSVRVFYTGAAGGTGDRCPVCGREGGGEDTPAGLAIVVNYLTPDKQRFF
jgi:hypothetical protein